MISRNNKKKRKVFYDLISQDDKKKKNSKDITGMHISSYISNWSLIEGNSL